MAHETVKDPESSSEFCLDCFGKHSGSATVLIGEALDRVRQDPQHQDKKTVEFIRLHANNAMDQLAEAENHVKKAIVDDPKIKDKLDKLGVDARVIRDQIRRYLKTVPNPQADNWEEKKEEIAEGKLTPRVDLLTKSLKEATDIRKRADTLSSEVGCGDCMASEEDLAKVEKALAELSSLPINNLINKSKDNDITQEILDTLPKPIPEEKLITLPALAEPSKDPFIQQIEKMEVPALFNSALDSLRINIQSEIIEKQAKRIKDEIDRVPVQMLTDITTAFFGSPKKK